GVSRARADHATAAREDARAEQRRIGFRSMATAFPIIYLARHGETAWSATGQHTGRSDIPLTTRGENNAIKLGERLRSMQFAKVFTSPLQRARRTCELAGFLARSEVDPDLVEWDY